MSRLSFIVPYYKKEKTIKKCLKSLFDQSLKDFEVIVVFDGEDKEAEDIVSKFKKCTMLTIPHGGAQKARNAGFKASKSDIVIFWDADCYIEPHAAKAWVDIFDANPGVGFIYSNYKFVGEKGAIHGEPFDPWLLRVRNYISTCFPVRRSFVAKWNETLQSLQDWDFWLSVVKKGAVGKYQNGYAFSTEFPDETSISGHGCSPENWLSRVDAVKKLHGLPERETCVSSLGYKADGIRLAKFIGADYQDHPNDKPHRYKNIIQLGFDLTPGKVELHSAIFNRSSVKNFLFWTSDNVSQIWGMTSLNAIDKYSILLNSNCRQFVEDKTSKKMMDRAGFNTEILPVPFEVTGDIHPLPTKPKFAVDISPSYGALMTILEMSLPDIELHLLTGAHKIEDYNGMIHLYDDKTMSQSIKRMLMAGRYVVSNVKSPYAGYIEDSNAEKFLEDIVDSVRDMSKKGNNTVAREYYKQILNKDRLLEAIK